MTNSSCLQQCNRESIRRDMINVERVRVYRKIRATARRRERGGGLRKTASTRDIKLTEKTTPTKSTFQGISRGEKIDSRSIDQL